jgi:hypothetical protein
MAYYPNHPPTLYGDDADYFLNKLDEIAKLPKQVISDEKRKKFEELFRRSGMRL